jgi:hypothetical protein
MRTLNKLTLQLFPLALATALCAGTSLPAKFSQPQSGQQAAPTQHPNAAELSKKETVSSALLRILDDEEYERRSAAEAMPKKILLSFGTRKIQKRKARVSSNPSPHFCRANKTRGLRELRVCRGAGWTEASRGLRQRRFEPRQIQERTADPSKRFVRRSTQIAEGYRHQEYVRAHRGPLRRPQYPHWHRRRRHLAQRRPLWQMLLYLRLNGIVPPASRPDPPKLKVTYSARRLVNFSGEFFHGNPATRKHSFASHQIDRPAPHE